MSIVYGKPSVKYYGFSFAQGENKSVMVPTNYNFKSRHIWLLIKCDYGIAGTVDVKDANGNVVLSLAFDTTADTAGSYFYSGAVNVDIDANPEPYRASITYTTGTSGCAIRMLLVQPCCNGWIYFEKIHFGTKGPLLNEGTGTVTYNVTQSWGIGGPSSTAGFYYAPLNSNITVDVPGYFDFETHDFAWTHVDATTVNVRVYGGVAAWI